MTSSKKSALADAIRPLVSRVRTDVTAMKRAGKKGSIWTRDELTDAALLHHVNGGPYRGVCFIKEGESVTLVAALDFDSHRGEATWDELVSCVSKVVERLMELGCQPVVWRSSGGHGVHVYLLWDEPQDAHSVRVYLREVLLDCDLTDGTKGVASGQVEVFPKQDRVGAGEFGNQMILPLAGESVLLEPMLGYEPLDKDACVGMSWPSSPAVPVIERTVSDAVAVTVLEDFDKLKSAVEALGNSGDRALDYDTWFTVMCAIHSGTGGSDAGRALALEMSSRFERHDQRKFDITWRSIKPVQARERAVSARTLYAVARRYGWQETVTFAPLAVIEPGESGDGDVLDADADDGAGVEGLRLTRDKNGFVEAVVSNYDYVLRSRSACRAVLGFDQFKDSMLIDEGAGWREFVDDDYTKLRLHLERGLSFKPVSAPDFKAVARMVAKEQSFDSAQVWLDSLEWDGVPRVERYLIDHMKCDDSDYVRAVSLYMWSAMAGRVMVPGVKADMMPVFVGPQGAGKTMSVAAIAPIETAFVEITLQDKDEELARKMRGSLVVEVGELRGLHTKELESIKAFISRQEEVWTPKYMEYTTRYKRRCIFIGTTNTREFLADPTGNRRFLPVTVGPAHSIDIDAIKANRDQLWAEAAALFTANGVMWQGAVQLSAPEHEKHMMIDDWEEPIKEWLGKPMFDGMTTPAEKEYLIAAEVAESALGIKVSQFDPYAQKRLGTVMGKLGYEKVRKRVGESQTRCFVKKGTVL